MSKLSDFEKTVDECEFELVRVANGSAIVVKLIHPGINGCLERQVHTKSSGRTDELMRMFEAFFESFTGRVLIRFSPGDLYGDRQRAYQSQAFKTFVGKFISLAHSIDKSKLRAAIDKNKQEQQRRLVAEARSQFVDIARNLLQRGVSHEDVQAMLNGVIVESVHLA
jgi:hypothetical protein